MKHERPYPRANTPPPPAPTRVWHEGGSCHYIMFAKPEGAKAPRRYRVDSFPVGSRLMNVLMAEVMSVVTAEEQLRRKLYQVSAAPRLAPLPLLERPSTRQAAVACLQPGLLSRACSAAD
jgi:hypothetical protein